MNDVQIFNSCIDDKPFTTYKQQVERLIGKDLLVPDEEYAISVLKKTSYFALINGYKKPFKNRDGSYKPNVTFEDIFYLYEFDAKLRSWLLKYALIVERKIKSLVSYYFSEKHKEEPYFYLKTENYRYDKSNPKLEDAKKELVERIKATVDGKRYRYINHYIHQGKVLPLWVVICALTFGQVSKLYSLSYPGIKLKVCKEYSNVKTADMELMLDILTKFRNVSAHNERLYDYDIISVEMPDTAMHKQLRVKKENGKYVNGKSDLFAALISFKYLLDQDDFLNCCNEIEEIFNSLRFTSNIIQQADIIRKTGFPRNWKDIREANTAKERVTQK